MAEVSKGTRSLSPSENIGDTHYQNSPTSKRVLTADSKLKAVASKRSILLEQFRGLRKTPGKKSGRVYRRQYHRRLSLRAARFKLSHLHEGSPRLQGTRIMRSCLSASSIQNPLVQRKVQRSRNSTSQTGYAHSCAEGKVNLALSTCPGSQTTEICSSPDESGATYDYFLDAFEPTVKIADTICPGPQTTEKYSSGDGVATSDNFLDARFISSPNNACVGRTVRANKDAIVKRSSEKALVSHLNLMDDSGRHEMIVMIRLLHSTLLLVCNRCHWTQVHMNERETHVFRFHICQVHSWFILKRSLYLSGTLDGVRCTLHKDRGHHQCDLQIHFCVEGILVDQKVSSSQSNTALPAPSSQGHSGDTTSAGTDQHQVKGGIKPRGAMATPSNLAGDSVSSQSLAHCDLPLAFVRNTDGDKPDAEEDDPDGCGGMVTFWLRSFALCFCSIVVTVFA